MKRVVAIAAVLVAVTVTVARQDDATKKDLMFMEGTWAATVQEVNGKAITDEENKQANAKLVVKDGMYTVYFGETSFGKGTIKLDATKKPKHVDAVASDGQSLTGIYQIDGDTMKVCFAPGGKDRPTEFKTKEGTGQLLISYKRSKK
jgi:uncharacterized protein (TIGR03067 family)